MVVEVARVSLLQRQQAPPRVVERGLVELTGLCCYQQGGVATQRALLLVVPRAELLARQQPVVLEQVGEVRVFEDAEGMAVEALEPHQQAAEWGERSSTYAGLGPEQLEQHSHH